MKATMIGLSLTLSLVGQAQAQVSGGQWRLSPEPNRARAGVEVKPQPTATAAPGSMVFPVQPVAFNLVPAVLMSDGTVWANFGFGFEPVIRSCGAAIVVSRPAVVAGNGAFIQQPSRPTFTQPVPMQPTASQQMVSATQRPQVSPVQMSHASQLACFSWDAAGRVFAYRF